MPRSPLTSVLRAGLLPLLALGTSAASAMDGPTGAGEASTLREPSRTRPLSVAGGIDSFPMTFEVNRGQAGPEATLVGRGSGGSVELLAGGAVFDPGTGAGRVAMRVRGARSDAEFEGVGPIPTRSNYLLGNDRSRWILRVPHFAGARAADLLPGIAMRWTGVPGRRARYDFECAPGSDPSAIAIEFDGAESVAVAADGRLEVRTAAGVLRHSVPIAWQERGSRRVPVRCAFRVRDGAVGFDLGTIDPALPLVIDPTLEFSAAYGGNSTQIHACGIDSLGYVVVAGRISTDVVTTDGVFQPSRAGADDAWIARYQPGGSTIDWNTYLGGQFDDRCWSLDIDAQDSIYLTGITQSSDFPLDGPYQSSLGGSAAAFVTKLAPTGDELAYSTFLGGTDQESGEGIAVDASGRAWVCGWTISSDFPLLNAVDSTRSAYEGFVTCLNPAGNGIVCSTMLGGSASEILWDVEVADDGTVWLSGETDSTNFPTVSPLQASNSGGTADAIVAALSSNGASLLFCSYLGGTGLDEAYEVALDDVGNPVFAGYTVSTDFPTASPLQSANGGGAGGGRDAVLFKIDASSKSLVFSTYFGGVASDTANAVAVDPDGGILISGRTRSSNLPTVDPVDDTYASVDDIFVSKISGDGSTLLFSTYFGGTTDDEARALATDGAVVVAAGQYTNPATNGFEGRTVSYRFLPDPFRRLRANQVTGSLVDLSWEDPHDGTYAVELQRATGTGAFGVLVDLDEGVTTYVDEAVSELFAYRYRVRGTSMGGNTAWSSTLRVTIPPRPPVDPSASILEDATVALEWTDDSSVETSYVVLRRVGASGSFSQVASVPAGSESWIDAGVLGETAYQYRIRTVAPGGTQAESVTVPITTPPRAPANFTVQPLDDISVLLSWQDLSSVETGYELQRRDDGAGGSFATSSTTGPGATMRIESGLSSAGEYTWRLRAVGAAGTSAWSPEVSLVMPPVPPSGLTVEIVDAETVRLDWVDESSGETGFRIDRRRLGDAAYSVAATADAGASSATVSGLLQKSQYELQVRSVGESGASRAIETVVVVMPAQIVIDSAKLTPASGARPARLAVAGRFDTGPELVDLLAGVALRIGTETYDLTGIARPRGAARYEEDGLRLDLAPARSGSSAVSFRLTVSGGVAEEVDPAGDLVLGLEIDTFDGTGGARLDEGVFHAARGIGSRSTPSLTIRSFKARLGEPGKHSFALKAAFRPFDSVPATAPDVRVVIGDGFEMVLDGSGFTERRGKFVVVSKGPPDWRVTVDPLKGSLTLRGARQVIGEFPAGAIPVRIAVSVGDRTFDDTPVLASTGTTLAY